MADGEPLIYQGCHVIWENHGISGKVMKLLGLLKLERVPEKSWDFER